jgi:hypothetical protein
MAHAIVATLSPLGMPLGKMIPRLTPIAVAHPATKPIPPHRGPILRTPTNPALRPAHIPHPSVPRPSASPTHRVPCCHTSRPILTSPPGVGWMGRERKTITRLSLAHLPTPPRFPWDNSSCLLIRALLCPDASSASESTRPATFNKRACAHMRGVAEQRRCAHVGCKTQKSCTPRSPSVEAV